MKKINIHDAKTNLSRLIDEAVGGEAFIIAKAGKPVVRVSAYLEAAPRRFGAFKGAYSVPDDIDTPFKEAIETMFYGESPPNFKKTSE